MKNVITAIFLAAFVIACTPKNTEESAGVTEAPKDEIKYNYSGNFKILPIDGYAPVENLMTGIETKDLEMISNAFADSVSIYFANGDIFNSTNDSLTSMISGFLDNLEEVVLIEHAGMVVEVPDQGHTWVLSWNSEFMVFNDGNKGNHVWQENFLIENGKIRSMRQYGQEMDDGVEMEDAEGFTYSGEFVQGDNALRQVVYDWNMKLSQDNPDFAGVEELLADSVTVYFADGNMMNTTRSEMMEEVKKVIGSFKDVEISFDALSVVNATNQNQTWVLSWTNEKYTNQEGEVEESLIHEDYMLEDGKIRLVRQYKMSVGSE